jgi:hypothetical protein
MDEQILHLAQGLEPRYSELILSPQVVQNPQSKMNVLHPRMIRRLGQRSRRSQ